MPALRRLLAHPPLPPWLLRHVRAIFILLLVLMVVLVGAVAFVEIRRHQPLVLPAPTGPYAVGRVEYDWTDAARADPLAPQAGTKRDLVVWCWYPAVRVRAAATAPYLPARWGQLMDEGYGWLGRQLIQSSGSIQTHSVADAPLATAAPFPVLIFEPGLGNIPTQYTTLLEDLASHGYVVFAIAPTYSADVVVFPDGRVARATAAGQSPESGADLQAVGDRLVLVWAADVRFVIDQVAALDARPGSRFSGRLDLARLGVFGHSFGGATAAEVCQLDRRCKAGIDLDGDLFGQVVRTGLTTPFFVLQAGSGTCGDAACRSFEAGVQAVLRREPAGDAYDLAVRGANHFNFSDYAVIFSPLKLLGVLGSIDGTRGLQITRTYVRAFFDTYLLGRPAVLLREPTPAYPEVRYIIPAVVTRER
jgi:dienelactone hydrolase